MLDPYDRKQRRFVSTGLVYITSFLVDIVNKIWMQWVCVGRPVRDFCALQI